jgi:hypothetical protein
MSEWHEGFVAGAVVVPLGIACVVALVVFSKAAVVASYRAFDWFLFAVCFRTGLFVPFVLWRALGYETLFAGRLVLLRGEQWPRKPVSLLERIVRNYKGTRVFLSHCRRAYLDGVKSPRQIAEIGRREAESVKP